MEPLVNLLLLTMKFDKRLHLDIHEKWEYSTEIFKALGLLIFHQRILVKQKTLGYESDLSFISCLATNNHVILGKSVPAWVSLPFKNEEVELDDFSCFFYS